MLGARFTVGCVVALVLGDVAVARAEPGEVDVVLTDGTRVHGRIKELIPDDHCTVQGSDGLVTIPWQGIVRIVPTGASDTPVPPTANPNDSAVAPSGALVRVHLIAAKGVRLEKSVAGGPWELACDAPCDADLPVDAAYRAMDGAVVVKGFRLETYGHPRITVDVSTGNTAVRVLGIIGVVTGTIVAYVELVAATSTHNGSNTSAVPIMLVSLIVAGASAIGIGVSGSGVSQKATGSVEPSRRFASDETPSVPRTLTAPLLTIPF